MRTFLGSVVLLLALAATTAAPSVAAPAERYPVADLSFSSTNECTGTFTRWTQSNQFIVRHESVSGTATHEAFTISGDVLTEDGFSGRFTATFRANVTQSDDFPFRWGVTGIATTYNLRDASGRVLLTHEVVHLVVLPDGEIHGSVTDVERRCLGRPS